MPPVPVEPVPPVPVEPVEPVLGKSIIGIGVGEVVPLPVSLGRFVLVPGVDGVVTDPTPPVVAGVVFSAPFITFNTSDGLLK